MDQSAVTVNICLGGEFSGAEVDFEYQRDDPQQDPALTNSAVAKHTPVTHELGKLTYCNTVRQWSNLLVYLIVTI
jgi:hypothetical protein